MASPLALVADDSKVFRILVSEVLQEKGFEVVEAADGRAALDLIRSSKPHLLVLDGLMPGLSGFEVLAQIRDVMPDYRPRIFVVTAVYKSHRWETEARQRFQVDEYMEKPLEPSDLLAAVERYFPATAG